MAKRTAREIIVDNNLINNKNIYITVGTTENRNCPNTVYLNISFWIKPKFENRLSNVQHVLNNLITKKLSDFLENNNFFPKKNDNIFICNVPEYFNYNDKFNFVLLEAYLHTVNIDSEKKYPLDKKKNIELFNECIIIINYLGDELNNMENEYFFKRKLTKKL